MTSLPPDRGHPTAPPAMLPPHSRSYLDAISKGNLPESPWIRSFMEREIFPGRGNLICCAVSEDGTHIEENGRFGGPFWHVQRDAIRRVWQESQGKKCQIMIALELSKDMINTLGPALNLSPLVFVRHLQQSNLVSAASDDSWISNPVDGILDRKVITLTWWRPVYVMLGFEETRTMRTSAAWENPPEDDGSQGGHSEQDVDDYPTAESLPYMEVDNWAAKFEMMDRNIRPSRNIHRTTWTYGIQPAGLYRGRSLQIPAAWREKITIYRETRDGTDFILVLSDPLRDKTWAYANPTTNAETAASGEVKHMPMSPRWTPAAFQWTHPEHLRLAKDDLLSWMTDKGSHPFAVYEPRNPALAMHPLRAAFMVAFLDTMTFADAFSKTLDDMQRAATEEVLLRRFMSSWVAILSKGQTRLPAVRQSLEAFVQRVFPDGNVPYPSDGDQFPPTNELLAQVSDRLDSVAARAENVYGFVRAEFAALEARKQLSESESVTRLTELAFIFIPLSFVASTFSTQVQELQGPPALYIFFCVSVGVLALAYAARLFVRSAVYTRAGKTISLAVRSERHVPSGQPIPPRDAVSSLLPLLVYSMARYYAIGSAHALAVVWLWAGGQELDKSLKAMITTLVVLVLGASLTSAVSLKPWFGTAAKKG